MDYVLKAADEHLFTPYIYPEKWTEDDIWRQFLSLVVISSVGGMILYFITATVSYLYLFDHRLLKHPQFLKNQIRREIKCAVASIPIMGVLTAPIFVLEVRGYCRLYDNYHENKFGAIGLAMNAISFIIFTDTLIYWCHRWLHSKYLYKPLHKLHHTWIIPTPFASHAFNPVDGFIQSLPYHFYVFLFPMHKLTYLLLFIFVNVWTVSIHDANCQLPNFLRPIINGSAHHIDHHTMFNYNYGQFFTFWDRVGKSYHTPSVFQGKGPLNYLIKAE